MTAPPPGTGHSEPHSTAHDSTVTELNHWLSYLLRRADRDITRLFLGDYGWDQTMPPVALSLLMLVSTSPGLDQREIARELGLDNANTARLIRKLDASGWLARRHPAGDYRKQDVYLTPQGVRELSKLKRDMRRFEQKIAGILGKAEHATLIALLEKLHQSQYAL